jgi:Protein of unknown function (DUF3617)
MNKTLIYAAALLGPIGLAYAVDMPQMKEGLWSNHMQTTENPGNKTSETNSTVCRSHAYDLYVQGLAKNMKGCTLVGETLQGNKYSTKMHCTIAGSVMESSAVASIDGESSAHSETHTTTTPPLYGIAETTIVLDSKYVGSCPAGVEPGDITYANGRVVHGWKH